MASASVTFCWLVDLVGSAVGVFLNVLLLAAIFRSSRRKQAYSFMFLFTAGFDLAYSLLELAIQRRLTVEQGVLVVMPHGVERLFPSSLYGVVFLHLFLAMNSIFILPCQYKYRYDILNDSRTTVERLVLYVCVASAVAVLCGANAVWVAVEQQRRPAAHYVQLLEAAEVDGREFYLYGADIEDLSSRCFYYFTAPVTTNIALFLCAFYLWKSVRFVNSHQTTISSEHTRSLARQFKISLIVQVGYTQERSLMKGGLQTINFLVFAFAPNSILSISIVHRVRFLSSYTMLPASWLPAVNALTTLLIIKPYKRYVASLFRCKDASLSPSQKVGIMAVTTATQRLSRSFQP
ncbi:hypothetical protein M3Y99_01308400 [Aphelenchoides fujianensis]|nr:hypothetical protein M3Y99_01308400 [Aphelenchoides fujianensis]